MSASQEEATLNADGSATFEDTAMPPIPSPNDDPTGGAGSPFEGGTAEEEMLKQAILPQGIDPVVYLLLGVGLVLALYYFLVYRNSKKEEEEEMDAFFSQLDGEKFNLKLPTEVEEYYAIKAKCEAAGWEAGKGPPPDVQTNPNAAGPYRVLAQALMKRAIADIPMVTHIQKESAGMNKLYAQSMCSVAQWRAYQAAEALVSQEVEEVRAEADEIEPGWSGAIWRQAMQYHNMLKQRHEMEAKAAEAQAQKRKEVEQKVMAAKQQVSDAEAKERAAQLAAEELIREEENAKKKAAAAGGGAAAPAAAPAAAAGSGMKKGFLQGKGKKK